MQQDLFQSLPNDIIFEVLQHLSPIDLIFSMGDVCKYWRNEVVNRVLCEKYPELFSGKNKSLSQVLSSPNGKRWIKFWLRQRVMSYARELYRHQEKVDEKVLRSDPVWLKAELETLKFYFSHFVDLLPEGSVKKEETPVKGSFLSQALGYLSSMFGKKSETTTIQPLTTTPPTINKDYDMLYKCIMDGSYGAGKTSFLNCLVNENKVKDGNGQYFATIGVDFQIKFFELGDMWKGKMQLWDQCGPERFRSITMSYYRGASFIYLMYDMTDTFNFTYFKEQLKRIKDTPIRADVEFIVLATKSDKKSKRVVSKEEGENIAFNDLNGSLYMEITNTELEDSFIVSWYSALMKYLLTVNCPGKI